ncbi:pyridoxal phosphate-dependent aminotransferase family protein [Kordia sp.]|uniref:aminotransferase class I/II-fold pyridoxal phosphate-dependent enzyme n=1 Tax=Kordia sp. TaxID=1965332 RepID=UPI0025BA8833|nr:pyridoxal phosphate-dependent aminotransferase family protein [Kordia sp.]MCH2192632.1 pyridoxal phosphate-dependent aminotransferase family protein [Kordia sp.]
MKTPKKIQAKLKGRLQNNSLRELPISSDRIDFSSNDYLGFATSESIFNKTHQLLLDRNIQQNGATGSRLLSGNHELYREVEAQLCKFHNSEAALLFNSGYDANIGFFSTVPQRGDVILYDESIHASIRDGIGMGHAKSYKFKHNNLTDLQERIQKVKQVNKTYQEIYVVTESVFSMDGDSPDLKALVALCKKEEVYLVIDEAHALGVFGQNGQGLLHELNLENEVFARTYTFGKALGCHGAVVVGSETLKKYLVNFSRSLIYTTGLSPHAVATIKIAYEELLNTNEIQRLRNNITIFREVTKQLNCIPGNAAIHCCILSGNENVKNAAKILQERGFQVKPILSPTVPKGKERLRFCLHSYNTEAEIKTISNTLQKIQTCKTISIQ